MIRLHQQGGGKILMRLHGFFQLRIRKDWNFRRVMEMAPAMRWLNPKSNERILDIGCGDGTYDYRIVRRGALVIGFDTNQDKLRKAARFHAIKGLVFLKANAEELPVKDGSFDVVVSFCVFEHLQNDRKALAEANRALRSGGRLLLTLDSLSRTDIPESWRDKHREKHKVRQFYTVSTIDAKLQSQGFHLIRYRYLLGSRLDFKIIKLSYSTEKMNTLPAALIRTALITIGRGICFLFNLFSRAENGWTLMVEASKV
ncbi:MAG: class I SAM-dependent methyltransferase [bacterium]